MADSKIHIGLIGAGGNMQQMHIPRLKKIKGVKILAVANRSRASGQVVAEQFDIPEVCDDWRQVMDDPRIDAVVIGTWPYMHATLTIAALEAGKHVLCEARMASNADQARAMLDASLASPDCVAQIVPSPFTLGIDDAVIARIAEGFLGPWLAIELHDVRKRIDRQSHASWRQDAALSGLNIMTLGIWYEAIMRWAGPATSVAAMGKTVVKTRLDDQGVRRAMTLPDHLDVLADMACGAQMHMKISQVMGLAEQSGIWLIGEEGRMHIDITGQHVTGWAGDASGGKGKRKENANENTKGNAAFELDVSATTHAGWNVEEDFIAAVRGQQAVARTDMATAMAYMEFTEAVTRSLQSRQTISLPL